ncbi:MAG TPA: bifunctional phosphopantothenoylcysteine decarboxylase/phosphopantothenate--cysteine ligase CoaBC [Methylocystis sp.]|nr:bifunctional phosphopantothenoylcysteine decarboxylase/phosphopantothenate--cysteine ligase CoaBC [Methylocystis sp.]
MTPQPDAQPLAGRRLLLIVGGGVAAYKSLELVRRLREAGASVRVVVTAGAQEFVTPLSFAALSGERVHTDLFDAALEGEMGHIALSRQADLVVVAPATANLLARAAQGLASDLATTLLLATDKRVLFAPAMNVRMWLHKATQRNLAQLKEDGALFVGPNEGDMACGEFGPGRMSEPHEILRAVVEALAPAGGALKGRHVLVTSGPTHEPIDPVRFIANRSSGKQGHAIAAAAAAAGAKVTLVSGPVNLPDPPGVVTRHVETAREMLEAVEAALPADIFIGVAAVADWRVEAAPGKIKKQAGATPPLLNLLENPDILKSVAARKTLRPALVVGFAAETSDLLQHARAKLDGKGCDLIVANDVSASVFGADANEAHIVSREGVDSWLRMSKAQVADRLVALLAGKLVKGTAS